MKLEYEVNVDEMVLKDFILYVGVSRALARRIKLYGKMYINGEIAKNYFLVKRHDKVILEYNEDMNEDINTVDYSLDILYEDEHLLVINKEKNLASQPSIKHQYDNLISYVKAYFIKKNINTNIHLVNRLDYATSGLIIIAKDGYTHHLMSKIDIERKYLAIVEGILEKKEDEINIKIGRVEEDSIKRWVMEDGKEAITLYRVIKENNDLGFSLVEATLKTGRTHQIRVSMAYLNHPVMGDKLYGSGEDLKLHCYYLKFKNPYLDEYIELTCMPIWEKDIEK